MVIYHIPDASAERLAAVEAEALSAAKAAHDKRETKAVDSLFDLATADSVTSELFFLFR